MTKYHRQSSVETVYLEIPSRMQPAIAARNYHLGWQKPNETKTKKWAIHEPPGGLSIYKLAAMDATELRPDSLSVRDR